MKRTVIVSLVMLLTVNSSLALNQQDELLFYNIGLGGVIGGIGSVINKSKGESWHRALAKGFLKGSFGGLLSYQGKRLACEINKRKKLEYGWLAKIVHSAGASIIENAQLDQDPWKSWNIHFCFVRCELGIVDRSLRVKLLPYATYSFLRASMIGSFDLGKTLKTGTAYFVTDKNIYDRFSGYTFCNDIIVNEKGENKHRTIAHEYIHNFQFREYLALNGFADKILERNQFCKKLSKFIHPDTPFQPLAYMLEDRRGDTGYYSNFFEMEAEYFATLKTVVISK